MEKRTKHLLLAFLLPLFMPGPLACVESVSDPDAQAQLSCDGGPIALAVTNRGGGPLKSSLETSITPYGHSIWLVDGKCQIRKAGSQHEVLGASLAGQPEFQEVSALANSSLFELYKDQRLGTQCADGTVRSYFGKKGAIHCLCGCMDRSVLPADLAQVLARIDLLAGEAGPALQVMPISLGITAINANHPRWQVYANDVPEANWQSLQLPYDLSALAGRETQCPIRITDPTLAQQLRELHNQHQSWQDARPQAPSSRNPKLMYLKDAGGEKFVVGVVELMEPDLSLGDLECTP